MPDFFRALAIDYDGTLTESSQPDADLLAAIAEARAAGRKVILCTGRILEELLLDWPEAQQPFDALVAENGAVLVIDGRERPLTAPVPLALDDALRARGIAFRRGSVLLATEATYAGIVLNVITRLGIDCQLVHNRSALMVLPPGTTKGTGLVEALAELGVSRHSTIAIGDAENDHALLAVAEIGVAVGNAVPSLQATADVVLSERAGAAVAGFLRGPILSGQVVVQPRRWEVQLGAQDNGMDATLPGSRINVLIAGATGTGKSYLAGLLVERLVDLGYVVCVFDPEGDHTTLGGLRGVLSLGNGERPPAPEQLPHMISHRFSSIVVDLSLLQEPERRAYYRRAIAALRRLRARNGLPHWIVVEEADQMLPGGTLPEEEDHLPPYGFCLVTYHPQKLAASTLTGMDAVLALRGAETCACLPPVCSVVPDLEAFTLEPGYALLADRAGTRRFRIAERVSEHVRHWHKYLSGQVPAPRRFFFRSNGGFTGGLAGNLSEFHREIRRARADTLHHHLRQGDFSAWVRDVIGDEPLATRLRGIERWCQTEDSPQLEVGRRAVLRAIEQRYGSEVDEPAARQ